MQRPTLENKFSVTCSAQTTVALRPKVHRHLIQGKQVRVKDHTNIQFCPTTRAMQFSQPITISQPSTILTSNWLYPIHLMMHQGYFQSAKHIDIVGRLQFGSRPPSLCFFAENVVYRPINIAQQWLRSLLRLNPMAHYFLPLPLLSPTQSQSYQHPLQILLSKAAPSIQYFHDLLHQKSSQAWQLLDAFEQAIDWSKSNDCQVEWSNESNAIHFEQPFFTTQRAYFTIQTDTNRQAPRWRLQQTWTKKDPTRHYLIDTVLSNSCKEEHFIPQPSQTSAATDTCPISATMLHPLLEECLTNHFEQFEKNCEVNGIFHCKQGFDLPIGEMYNSYDPIATPFHRIALQLEGQSIHFQTLYTSSEAWWKKLCHRLLALVSGNTYRAKEKQRWMHVHPSKPIKIKNLPKPFSSWLGLSISALSFQHTCKNSQMKLRFGFTLFGKRIPILFFHHSLATSANFPEQINEILQSFFNSSSYEQLKTILQESSSSIDFQKSNLDIESVVPSSLANQTYYRNRTRMFYQQGAQYILMRSTQQDVSQAQKTSSNTYRNIAIGIQQIPLEQPT